MLPLLLWGSCKKDNARDCFKSNGANTVNERNLTFFDRIEVQDKINVKLVQGTEYKAVVKAGQHIITNIKTDVTNGCLKIWNKNTCNVVRGYKHSIEVVVTLPHVRELIHNSVSDLRFDHFEQDSIYLNLESSGAVYLQGNFRCIRSFSNGNGDLYLSGSARRLFAYTQGTNYVHAEDLMLSETAEIHQASLGDVHLNAQGLNTLIYRIRKSGNLYYSGSVGQVTGQVEKGASGRLIHSP